MQDIDYQQPSEKDVVQPEDISNAPTEKCLENVGFEFEKYVDVDKQLQEQIKKDIEYYHNVLKRVIAVVKYLAIRGLAFRGTEEVFGSHKGNLMGALELLAEFDPFIREHIEQRELRPKSSTSYLSKTIYEQIIEVMGKQIIKTITIQINNGDTKYYSVGMDSVPDLSHNDQLAIILRYCFRGKVGQPFDNAANMSGQYDGVQALLKENNKFANYVPCAAYSPNVVGAE
ncbi:zinc finger MYM-type protein 1 [Trichonephila clavipes]|nr:zinc finger MYM-type protein 1 [Trichonephila clavipes]